MYVMFVVACIALAITHWTASLRNGTDGLRQWGGALCVHAAGGVLLAMRGMIPDVVSIIAANVLISLSYSVFLHAVHVFLGRRTSRDFMLWGPPIVALIGLWIVMDDMVLRVVFVNFVLCVQALIVGDTLLGHKCEFPVRGRNLLLCGILLSTAALAWKVGVAVVAPERLGVLFQATPVQQTLTLVALVSIIFVSNGFVLMAKERSDAFLRNVAMLDRLTGCWNRIRIEEIARQEMARLRRYGHPASVLMLDLDHFKAINDTHGHAVGDAVLRGFSDLLREAIRGTDFAGRWGGEEFIVIMPFSDMSDAVCMAERIRARLEKAEFAHGAPVTTSIGVAGCRSTDTWEEWLGRADMALYRAKSAGRNVVRVENLEVVPDEPITGGVCLRQLQWNPACESGHALIDTQHKELFVLINELLRLGAGGGDSPEIRRKIEALYGRTVTHFQDEERVLREHGYARLDEHAKAHQHLLDRAHKLLGLYERGEVDLPALFHFMIYELTAQHMMIDDQRFFRVLQDKDPHGGHA